MSLLQHETPFLLGVVLPPPSPATLRPTLSCPLPLLFTTSITLSSALLGDGEEEEVVAADSCACKALSQVQSPLSVCAPCQAPAKDILLPYTSKWDIQVSITEHWNSTMVAQGSLRRAKVGDHVSVYPLEQWAPTQLLLRVRMASQHVQFSGTCRSSGTMCGLILPLSSSCSLLSSPSTLAYCVTFLG